MSPRENFTWETDVDTFILTDPKEEIKCSVFEGKLTVQVKDRTETVDLPEDVFTDDAHAELQHDKLHIRIGRRDPNGPAMQEKRMFNPDRHPVELDVAMPKHMLAKSVEKHRPLLPHHTDKTPAEQSVDEVNPALYGDPHAHYKMPAVNMGSSIVTAMPTMVNEGGALDTVSKGETVVRVPGSAEVHHLTGIKQHPGDNLPSGEELAHKLRDTAVHDMAPPGATVLAGQKAAENEAAFDERALPPGAAADSPAGDEEHALARGQHGDKVRADFVMHKVGMVNEELTAADMYPRADDSKVEPISSVKQPGVPKCEMCACAPCQCGQMRKTGGTSNDPFELTYPEQKRGGRPHIHSHHREVTGKNAHEARDYRGHAKQGQIEHAHIGAKLGDYQGNVSEGIGDPNDPKYQHLGPPHPRGATHTGGAPIEFPGEPGRRQVSDAVAGGPMRHGAKTNIHTLG